MEQHKIQALLSKYWEAETSIEEERMLKAYFSQEDVAEAFQHEKALFQFFDAEEHLQMKSTIPLPTASVVRMKAPRKGRWIMGIAASMLLAVSAFLFVQQKSVSAEKAIVIEHEDPEAALADLKIALAYISGKMNQSIESANVGLEKVNDISKLFNEETL